jgi:hypothetical protein
MIPEFIRHYHYTATDTLNEYAVRFFALVNAMYRLKAQESLELISNVNTAFNGNSDHIHDLKKQEKGIAGIVEEVRVIRNV